MAQADDQIYTADDKSVGEMLHRLFEQGHDEVEIQHPLEGARVITRAEFYGLVDALEKSPAEKLVERKKIERLAKLKRKQFRKAMTRAKVHRVDLENDHVQLLAMAMNQILNLVDVAGVEEVPLEISQESLPPVQKPSSNRRVGQ